MLNALAKIRAMEEEGALRYRTRMKSKQMIHPKTVRFRDEVIQDEVSIQPPEPPDSEINNERPEDTEARSEEEWENYSDLSDCDDSDDEHMEMLNNLNSRRN